MAFRGICRILVWALKIAVVWIIPFIDTTDFSVIFDESDKEGRWN